jgi:glutaconate CoA-transferase, subunit A
VVVITTPDEAVRPIPAKASVAVGGSLTAGHPMSLVRALIRSGISGLTLVGGLTGGLELDLIVAAGLAARLVAPYIGAEDLASLPPSIRWAAEDARLEIWETDEGVHLAGLRAHAQRLPYATWAGGIGTALADSPLVEVAVDEPSGTTYFKVRPLAVDVALLWAEAADEDGNILLWGPDLGDEVLRNAADQRIIQVERIVSTEALSRHPDRVVPWQADVIVRSPLGTHPFASSSVRCDELWLTEYLDVVRAARTTASASAVQAFLDDWVHSCPNEDSYLSKVGVPRLRGLLR